MSKKKKSAKEDKRYKSFAERLAYHKGCIARAQKKAYSIKFKM